MPLYPHPIIFLDTIDSTNLFAQNLINSGIATHGTVIQAGFQTRGRGQRNNQWLSEGGVNLTFSIILLPNDLTANRHFELNQVFSLGILDYLVSKGVTGLHVKWPNDIMFSDKKLAGILLENTIRGKFITSIVAGIGFNINQESFSGDYALEPVSLKNIIGKPLDLTETLEELLHCIMFRYEQLINGLSEKLRTDYIQNLFKLNQLNKFKLKDEIWNGKIRGVSEDGELIVEDETGKLIHHPFGEIKMVL